MKRPLLLFAVLFGLTVTGIAQDKSGSAAHSRFYLKVTGGYFFSVSPGQFPNVGPYPPEDLHKEFNPTHANPFDTLSRKVLTGSYGQGVRGGLTVGYDINKYMSVEGTFNYFHSQKNLMTNQLTTLVGSGKELGHVESHGYVNAIDFAPSVVISPGMEKVNPYVRFGVVVPLWGRLYIETEASQLSQPTVLVPPGSMIHTVISRKEEIKPNITVGFEGALGVSFKVASRFDVFVEAEYRNVPVKSKEKEVTRYNETNTLVNGSTGATIQVLSTRSVDQLSVAEKKTVYVTTLDQNSNTPINQQGTKTFYKDDTKPSNDLKSYINIGGLGVNAGLKFRL
ncbi:outer membrane protein with beta-barrel domain [Chitinophaga niastensis]|uniref:Outer membrane protein with beta-barrel domain n=1 Tax=Chitinophaga niastensis TaxID=536980 RepID=A0A2P8HB76_CHINA|nr:outer membrane beta-barrel protein [Chitinophaga niastensis]PSL43470.1 outer membrane protein with beta-barrel domain [Chitinophaga niastensis]